MQVKKGYLLIFDEAEPALGWRLVWASLRGPLLYYASGKFADVQVRLQRNQACVRRKAPPRLTGGLVLCAVHAVS